MNMDYTAASTRAGGACYVLFQTNNITLYLFVGKYTKKVLKMLRTVRNISRTFRSTLNTTQLL